MKGAKAYGTYSPFTATPILLVSDPELIKQVVVKEFSSFTDRVAAFNFIGTGTSEIDLLWQKQVFITGGEEWKNTR